MRGADEKSGALFSDVEPEDRIPVQHPFRKNRRVVNDALASLIRASLIRVLFSIRSERRLMEQIECRLLFRWFVGFGADDAVWVPTVFTRNRDRLLTTGMSRRVMAFVGQTVPRTVC